MSIDQSVIIYILFWIVRINGCFRRGRQPLLRGKEWFFNVHVQPDFYTGAGRKILHRYWMRMFIPFALDIPLAIAIFHSGRLILLQWLIMGVLARCPLNHRYPVETAKGQPPRLWRSAVEQPRARLAWC